MNHITILCYRLSFGRQMWQAVTWTPLSEERRLAPGRRECDGPETDAAPGSRSGGSQWLLLLSEDLSQSSEPDQEEDLRSAAHDGPVPREPASGVLTSRNRRERRPSLCSRSVCNYSFSTLIRPCHILDTTGL